MNETTNKVTLIAAVSVSGYFIAKTVAIHRQEKKKRREIRENAKIEIAAIQEATRVMEARIKSGTYHPNIVQLLEDIETENEFQKIVFRQK